MGTRDQAKVDYNAYGTADENNPKGKNANIFNSGITKGLVTGSSPDDDYTEIKWKNYEPGFFTDDHLDEGKDKYTNYDLKLNKTGNTYKLTGVKRPDGSMFNCAGDGSWFLPLQEDKLKEDQVSDGKRFYFGMRYDINFKLGDYVGPLNYSFTGDDDLWVLLDGEVVIDLGGIHEALSANTDLWTALGSKEGVGATNDEDKKKNHRLTILYMERGGWRSNCKMEFTIPDPKFVDVNNVPLAEITIKKTNSNNKPLPGAMFRLTNDNDSSDTYPIATTDGNGKIKFDNLKVGEYTLTETVAPNGYVALKETYKIKVTVNDDKATAKLYKSDGTTEVEGNKIINYTETEEAEKNLTSSKSAKVVDDKNRIYQIDLNAEVTGKEADQEAKNASVVLVLDASDSMNDSIGGITKIAALRDAATQFVNTLSDKSADSEVSIIWYRGAEGGSNLTNTLAFQKLDPSGVKNLKSNIDDTTRTIGGGIPMGSALEAAYNQLGNAAKGNDKYVLFMTDGMPGHSGDGYIFSEDCMTANKALKYANKIKDSNDGKAVLYTVGVGLKDTDTFLWKAGHSDQSSSHKTWEHDSTKGLDFLAYNIASGSDHAYNTSDVTDLVNEFKLIAGKIGDLYTVQPTSIVDVIDARFELTEDSVNNLAQKVIAGKKGKVNNSKTEIIWKDDENNEVGKVTIVKDQKNGTTTITWTGAAAKIGNAAATEEANRGWKASFQVKAKDDFIGGNMIPTNGAASGIYLNGGGIKKFEQPSVNVKLLDLNIENKEITVFKGDPISPQNFRSELAETLKPLTIGENQEFEYTYPGSTDAAGKFICTYEAVKGNINEHTATEVGTAVEQYKLTVTYHPYSLDERKTKLSKTLVKEPTPEGGTVVSDLTKEGTYIVNVVAGELQIIKKLDTLADQNETFNFVIKDNNKTEVATATATVVKGSSEATAVFKLANDADAVLDPNNQKLTELSKGDYTVEEVLGSDARYELLNIEAGATTNCSSVVNKDEQQKAINITFTMGTYTTENGDVEVLKNGNTDTENGRIGVAEFTNKKSVVDIDFEKVDIQTPTTKLSGAEFDLYKADADGNKTNEQVGTTYTSDSNGGIAIENLPIGKYVLVETKAPAGYQCSAIPWKITVANDRTITVTYNGDPVVLSNNIYQLTNAKVYSLPESGGSGIYWYMIGGMVLMSTAAWILYKNKCKEVLGK